MPQRLAQQLVLKTAAELLSKPEEKRFGDVVGAAGSWVSCLALRHSRELAWRQLEGLPIPAFLTLLKVVAKVWMGWVL
jgi:hypothetical protein